MRFVTTGAFILQQVTGPTFDSPKAKPGTPYLCTHYELNSGLWTKTMGCELIRPENLADYLLRVPGPRLLVGNVFEVYAQRLPAALAGFQHIHALPTATALLRLAPALAAAGQCVDAALALPLYVRDKVAFTTKERAATKALAAQNPVVTHPGI